MCGIAGIVAADRLETEDRQRVSAMRDILAHRGPDEAGAHATITRLWVTAASVLSTCQAGSSRCRTKPGPSGSPSTARSTTTRTCARCSRGPATSIALAPTPRPSFTPTSSGETTACIASAGCSRSRSGTRRSGGFCSRAIGSVSSLSTGRSSAGGSSSVRRSRRSSRAGSSRLAPTRRRSRSS